MQDPLQINVIRKTFIKSRVVSILAQAMEECGFYQVDVPLLYPLEDLLRAKDEWLLRSAYKVIDGAGEIAVLRPDFTAAVSRIASCELRFVPRPLGLWYQGEIYRRSSGRFQPTAAFQAAFQVGAEIFGVSGVRAETDCIEIMWRGLKALGFSDFRISVGHAGIFREWCRAVERDGHTGQRVREALANRDLVAAREAAASLCAQERDLLFEFLRLRGGSEVIDAARGVKAKAKALGIDLEPYLDVFAEILGRLESKGISDKVVFDLGLLRNLQYYSGTVFEAYVPGIGVPVAGGGRYSVAPDYADAAEPAIGFAFWVDPLVLAIDAAEVGFFKAKNELPQGEQVSPDVSKDSNQKVEFSRKSCLGFLRRPHTVSGIH
ncbi:MAG TPA: hypothetical protein GX507_10090 [Clostridia bacterium]|nr:hypothetical protein [Clostridia bacterium]